MKLPYLRRLLTLLTFFDILIFKPVGIPLETNTLTSDKEKILLTTNKPPEVLALKAVYCPELTKCPNTDDEIYWRKLCFMNAYPEDKIYHCGVDEDQRTVVEFYYPRYPCDKGYYGTPKIHGESVKMACKMCPAGRFSPERRWSPENMDACRTHLHIPAEPHTVLFRPGNSTDPEVYFCDATNGWASAHRSLFCRPSYQPCSCTYQGESCPGEELLPDSRCVPKCEGQRLPEKNFSCVQSTESAITTSQPIGEASTLETSTSLSTQATTTSGLLAGDDWTSHPHSKTDYGPKDNLSVGLLCGFIAVILLVLVLTVLCYKKRNCSCKINENTWNIGRDYVKAGQAENINLDKTTDNESAQSLSTDDTADGAASGGESERGLLERATEEERS